MFWPLVWGSTVISAGLFGIVWMYWRWWPNKQHSRRVGDMRAMRRLLSYHIDDLEDVMTALREHMAHGVSEQHLPVPLRIMQALMCPLLPKVFQNPVLHCKIWRVTAPLSCMAWCMSADGKTVGSNWLRSIMLPS